MTCLHCNAELTDDFFLERSRSQEFKGGRFACPLCGAEHIRRLVGQLPSGAPLYSIRLWGHLRGIGRTPLPVGPLSGDRRLAPRRRRWR
ncbi:MAG TPA: hypothetical protein VEN81_10015 [Planctomycetota bacterium]|nr:hypothetical protein [Planctomycetota bacterium]